MKLLKFDGINRYIFTHISFPTAPSISVILLLWITIFSTAVTSLPAPKFTNGTNTNQKDRLFVNDISKCPSLPPRAAPATNVRDLRADDIKVVMGLGDSVIAGFGVRVDKLEQIVKDGKDPLDEYRGANFAVGGDSDVVSIPNILRKFSPNLIGDSKGTHIIEVCYGILCPSDYIPKSDQLNAAQSGAQALNIDKQVNYLIDQLSQRKDIDVKNDWKLATVWFGNNDLCNGCTDLSKQIQFSPDQFESHIREGLEKLRNNVPRVFVNLMSVFKISQMFEASLKDKNCLLGKVAGLFLECQCAFVPGPLGDKSRKSMDDLADQYNKRLKKITSDFQEKNYQDFIVSYDPGMENMDLSNASLDLLSGVDCFHPSLLAHERIAKAVWNNIFAQESQKTSKYDPTSDLPILCPNEDDRLR